jgi:phosphatidate cytidylyltransferase
MLRTRLWVGTILVALAASVLVLDQRLTPTYPFLLGLVFLLAGLACRELLGLLGPRRPSAWTCYLGVLALVAANWAPVWPVTRSLDPDAWHWIAGTFAGFILFTFLVEMGAYRAPGESLTRMALAIWTVSYLGLLPAFFVQLRWWRGPAAIATRVDPGTLALALAIFVPKCGDIGAYFTGRRFGRHPMAPVLSPKKTWEGAAGGVAASMMTAIVLDRLGPIIPWGLWGELAFGLTVGAAGLLGDLAESLIKRDCERKDASQTVPGFGGVLDVIDAVVFAAPVAYWWLNLDMIASA